MRRTSAALALVLTASCSSIPPREAQVRRAFEAWRDAAAAGDAEKTFRGMSAAFKSDWIFQRLVAVDPLVTEWRGRLEGPARTDLDLWLEHQKKYRQGRAVALKETVLDHPSVVPMWVACFRRDQEAVKLQFSSLAITSVYLDEGGATVTARNMLNKGEMYGMVPEPDGWKIDGHREAIRSIPK